jgi:hypothetical protein
MRTAATLCILISLFSLVVTGCKHVATTRDAPTASFSNVIDGGPISERQQQKDDTVKREATAIREELPASAPRVGTILSAIDKAPASEVRDYVSSMNRAVAERDEFIAKLQDHSKALGRDVDRLTKENNNLKSGVRRTVTVMMNGFAMLLVVAGIVIAISGGKVAAFGPVVGVSIGLAGLAVFALAQVYDWIQQRPWVVGIVLVPLAFGFAVMVANVMWAKSKEVIAGERVLKNKEKQNSNSSDS